MSRLNGETTDKIFYDDLLGTATITAAAWMSGGLIKRNSWGVVVLFAARPGSDFTTAERFTIKHDQAGAKRNGGWYVDNADNKSLISKVTGLDSHEAVRLYQGALAHLDGAFPWGGAIIDAAYGLIVATSGFEEDEDILFSRTIRNRIVLQLDRLGDIVIGDAHARGEREGDAAADRFTRRASGLLAPAA